MAHYINGELQPSNELVILQRSYEECLDAVAWCNQNVSRRDWFKWHAGQHYTAFQFTDSKVAVMFSLKFS